MAAAVAGSSADMATLLYVAALFVVNGTPCRPARLGRRDLREHCPHVVVRDVLNDPEATDGGSEHKGQPAIPALLVSSHGGEHGRGVDGNHADRQAEHVQEPLLSFDRAGVGEAESPG